jgi:hypothetical protein
MIRASAAGTDEQGDAVSMVDTTLHHSFALVGEENHDKTAQSMSRPDQDHST